MAEINLSQNEADKLIVMEKHRVDNQVWIYPSLGGKISIPLISADGRIDFWLDINQNRINLQKVTYQNRVYKAVILVRLDIEGPPHRNPDGELIKSSHIHIYREGYHDKWAYPIPTDKFSDISDNWQILRDFMVYCNITYPPTIQMQGVFASLTDDFVLRFLA